MWRQWRWFMDGRSTKLDDTSSDKIWWFPRHEKILQVLSMKRKCQATLFFKKYVILNVLSAINQASGNIFTCAVVPQRPKLYSVTSEWMYLVLIFKNKVKSHLKITRFNKNMTVFSAWICWTLQRWIKAVSVSLTRHSSRRAGRAMMIISFLTSCVTKVTSTLSERSWAWTHKDDRENTPFEFYFSNSLDRDDFHPTQTSLQHV